VYTANRGIFGSEDKKPERSYFWLVGCCFFYFASTTAMGGT
jgi:hypothetical protein